MCAPLLLPHTQVVAHKEFLAFVADFSLTKSSLITSHDMGAIFMASQKRIHMDDAGCLTFEDFWETLCRCALVAFADKGVPLDSKLKALFLNMTREIKWSDMNDGGHLRGVDSNPQLFYLGAKQFQNSVSAMWLEDGRPDYLTGIIEPPANCRVGRDLLKRMVGGAGDGQERVRPNPHNLALHDAGADGTILRRAISSPSAAAANASGASKSGKGGGATSERDKKKKNWKEEPASRKKVIWREVYDPQTGRNYYYNVNTRMTTWVDPRGTASAVMKAADKAAPERGGFKDNKGAAGFENKEKKLLAIEGPAAGAGAGAGTGGGAGPGPGAMGGDSKAASASPPPAGNEGGGDAVGDASTGGLTRATDGAAAAQESDDGKGKDPPPLPGSAVGGAADGAKKEDTKEDTKGGDAKKEGGAALLDDGDRARLLQEALDAGGDGDGGGEEKGGGKNKP